MGLDLKFRVRVSLKLGFDFATVNRALTTAEVIVQKSTKRFLCRVFI